MPPTCSWSPLQKGYPVTRPGWIPFYTKDEDVLPYSFYTEYNRLITAWETINNTKVPEHIRQIWDPKFPSHDGIYTSTMPDSRSKRP